MLKIMISAVLCPILRPRPQKDVSVPKDAAASAHLLGASAALQVKSGSKKNVRKAYLLLIF